MTATTGQTTTGLSGAEATNAEGKPRRGRHALLERPVVSLLPDAPFLALQWQALRAGAVIAAPAPASRPERARHAFD